MVVSPFGDLPPAFRQVSSARRPRSTRGERKSSAECLSGVRDWTTIQGVNFIPGYARNAYEAWTRYDAAVTARELGLARRLGFNSVRLRLHSDAYFGSPESFLKSLADCLDSCDRLHLTAMPVLFDSCGFRGGWFVATRSRVLRASSTRLDFAALRPTTWPCHSADARPPSEPVGSAHRNRCAGRPSFGSFCPGMTLESAAIYGTLQEATYEELPGACPCPSIGK